MTARDPERLNREQAWTDAQRVKTGYAKLLAPSTVEREAEDLARHVLAALAEIDSLAASLREAQEARESLRFELQGKEATRLRDNEYLIARAEQAELVSAAHMDLWAQEKRHREAMQAYIESFPYSDEWPAVKAERNALVERAERAEAERDEAQTAADRLLGEACELEAERDALAARNAKLEQALRRHLDTHDGLALYRPCSCAACEQARAALAGQDADVGEGGER